jgi:hypothetical protein
MLLTQIQIRFKHTFNVEQEILSELFYEIPSWTLSLIHMVPFWGIQNYFLNLSSHGTEDVDIVLLSCDAVSTHRQIPMFWYLPMIPHGVANQTNIDRIIFVLA